MDKNKKFIQLKEFVFSPNFTLFIIISMFVFGVLSVSGFYLFKKTAYLDDSFIYLHMAANIVELGTARYFPITESQLLLSSSPLRLLTLVPGFFILQAFDVPLRTIEAARFAFLCSGFVAFLFFVLFWINKLKIYLLVSATFFLLGASLDSLFLMEGGVLFFSLFTLVKLLTERSENYFLVGVAVLLVGLSRPEIGVIAIILTVVIYINQTQALLRFIFGLVLSFAIYCLLMLALDVYPVPSTIWSKQITGKLKLFSDKNLIEVLPISIANIMGLHWPWIGWLFITLPAAFSIPLKKGSIPILFAVALLLMIAISMPGNFVWYNENFLIALFVLSVAVAIEIYKKNWVRTALTLKVILLCGFSLILFTNFGKKKPYPWNENSPIFSAYHEIGKSSIGEGKYVVNRYSSEPVRIRMCEIGIVSFFSSWNAWIYDICGLAQIGNLKGASQNWLRHFYPSSFVETGDDQLKRFKDNERTPVIDVWAIRNEQEAANATGKCMYVDAIFCINQYK